MKIPNPDRILERLREFQKLIRDQVIASRTSSTLHHVTRASSADTIYHIDTLIEPLLKSFCEDWSRETPLVLIAEGFEVESGQEGPVTFPIGSREEDAQIRVIVDPIDGTRGIMYDKRPAWALAGVAPNKGAQTRLRDIELAIMTELPTTKMAYSDVLWAIKGQGARGERESILPIENPKSKIKNPLTLSPSQSATISHGFATISNFFPGTKLLAGRLSEHIALSLLGPADVTQATVFEDQYISTGGQFYEIIVGHDRFIADLRPLFYQMQKQPMGLCCHPYDCATWLIADEAGAVLTDGLGNPLDAPLDTTSSVSWAAFANPVLAGKIQPLIKEFFASAEGRA